VNEEQRLAVDIGLALLGSVGTAFGGFTVFLIKREIRRFDALEVEVGEMRDQASRFPTREEVKEGYRDILEEVRAGFDRIDKRLGDTMGQTDRHYIGKILDELLEARGKG